MATILQKDAPILRETASPVALEEIQSKEMKKIIADMREALDRESDGAGLAAPQIGVSLRLFIVSKKISLSKNAPEPDQDTVFINPIFLKRSRKKQLMEEGCLSIRWVYGKVLRSEKVLMEAYDEHGVKQTYGASKLLAQIFQHEVDHLDGILFTDKAIDLEYIPPKTQK
ncbi:MAG: peptide deformylase [Candidatus Paceibacterota bacterium]